MFASFVFCLVCSLVLGCVWLLVVLMFLVDGLGVVLCFGLYCLFYCSVLVLIAWVILVIVRGGCC